MNLRTIFVSVLILQFPIYVESQITTVNGYILSNTSDTVFGKIEYAAGMGFSNKCVFIDNNSNALKIYRPEQIRVFCIPDLVRFDSRTVNGKKSFLKVLVSGKISLYEGRSGLFISDESDSLILLKGGSETIQKDGRYIRQKVEQYKVQLKRSIKDTCYYSEIDRMNFDKGKIIDLIKDVNEIEDINTKNKKQKCKSHRYQYGIEAGYSTNTFAIGRNSSSTWLISYVSDPFKENYQYHVQLNFLSLGLNIKQKVASTNSYLNISLGYSQNINTNSTRKGIVYNNVVFPSGGQPYFDTTGHVTDNYYYRIKSVNLFLSYHAEFSYSRIRPFLEVGLSGSVFIDRIINLNREITVSNNIVENESFNPILNQFLLKPAIKIGCRFLNNKDYSMSAGFGFFGISIPEKRLYRAFQTTKKEFFVAFSF